MIRDYFILRIWPDIPKPGRSAWERGNPLFIGSAFLSKYEVIMNEDLAQTLLRAAMLKEISWDQDDEVYLCSIEEAADKACAENGFDLHTSILIAMLLNNSWNQSLEWSAQVLKES